MRGIIIIFIFLLIPLGVVADEFDYKNSASYTSLSSFDVESLEVGSIPSSNINLVLKDLSPAQYSQLTSTQIKNINVENIPPDKINLIQSRLSSKQYGELSNNQIQQLQVNKVPNKHLLLVVGKFSSTQYGEMSQSQVSESYFLVSNVAHLNQESFTSLVRSKRGKWNDADVGELNPKYCQPSCTLNEEGVLKSPHGQVTLGAYLKGSSFIVEKDKIVIYPPVSEVAFERSKSARKKGEEYNVRKDIKRNTGNSDLKTFFSNPPEEDKVEVSFADKGVEGVISIEKGKAFTNPNGMPPLTIDGVRIISPHKVQLIFDNRVPPGETKYLQFSPSRLEGLPGSGTVLSIKGSEYITSYSGDKNDRLDIGIEDDAVKLLIDSRRNLFTDEGKRYAPLISFDYNGETDNPKRITRILYGKRIMNFDQFMEVTGDSELGEEDLSSPIVEIKLKRKDHLVRTVVTRPESSPMIIEGGIDMDYLDQSGNVNCADKSCSFVFSGVNKLVVNRFITEKINEDAKIPKHLRYVVIGDKSKQQSYVIDVVTGEVVKVYPSSFGQYPGIKTDELAYRKTNKGLKLQYEGNYVTPEGRVRLINSIKPRTKYQTAALLSYPRPYDVDKAFNDGVINEAERDNFQAQLESIRTNPDRREAERDAVNFMKSSKTKLGSSILIHETNPLYANMGWTSAGCYSLNPKDMSDISKNYLTRGSELITISSTGEDQEVKRPYKSATAWRSEQRKNQETATQDMEDYLQRTGLLQANRERLASYLIKNQK